MKRIDHIGIAVSDLQKAKRAYETLGMRCTKVEEIESEKVRVALFPVGEGRIELMESTTPDGVIARFIARRGEGLHHICFAVHDIEEAMAKFRAEGLRLVDEVPRRGQGGHRIAFVHPESTSGVLIELREDRPSLRTHPRSPGARPE